MTKRSIPTKKTIAHFRQHKDWYTINRDYQREEGVWTIKENQYLIDSIIYSFPLPQFFVRDLGNNKLEIVDGQQRLTAIWTFLEDKYPLLIEYSGPQLGSSPYSKLPRETQVAIDNYELNVVELLNYDDNDIRNLFRRLQSGKPLNTGEKLNAFPGSITPLMRSLAKHAIFRKVNFSLKRYKALQLVAQTFILCDYGITDIGARYLYEFFDNNLNADQNSRFYKQSKKMLNYMNRIITDTTCPEILKPSWFVNYFVFTKELLEKYSVTGMKGEIYQFYKDFFSYIQQNKDLILEVKEFDNINRAGTNNKNSIKDRFNFMLVKFLSDYAIQPKDLTRGFTEIQRIAIYRKDVNICQNPNCGKDVPWDDYHADHKIPHSNSGPTTVDNGQVLCSNCNLAKSNNPNIGY